MEDEDGSARTLWELADLVTPMAVRVVATLRIADHIASGSRTATDLAGIAGADAGALDRVLRHLATAGLLTQDGDGYALTARGEALRADYPQSVQEQLDLDGGVGRADLSFVHLLHSVRTGESAYPILFGRPFWDDLASDPARSRAYDAEMGSDVSAWAPAIVAALDWGSLGPLVDVGGGSGSLLIALLREHAALRGTVVDLPETTRRAREAFVAAGLGERADAVPGSFFDPLPAGARAYLVCAILHDWDDASALRILRRCAEAAGRGGSVFVVEKIGADGESVRTGMDLRMLAYFGGRERGLTDLTALAWEAGLRVVAVHAAGDTPVVELTCI